jgi:hypothetical protein
MKCQPGKVRERPHGGVLLVLVVAALAIVVTITVVGLTTFSARQGQTAESSANAQTCAENNIAKVIAELQTDPQFGLSGHNGSDRLVDWTASGTFGSEGASRLTFSPTLAAQHNVACSLNNLLNDSPVEGWRRKVPAKAAQLIATARSGNQTRVLECVIGIPPFPYVVVSSGKFESQGNLLVGQLPEGVNSTGVGVDDLLPAHLAGNESVALLGPSTVLGDVQSTGEIAGAGIDIHGELRPNDDPVAIPSLEIEDLKPDIAQPMGVPGSFTPLTGFLKHDGDLTFNGNVELQETLLFVDGDVMISGCLQGVGAILATGTVTLKGQTRVAGSGRVAIFCNGDLTIRGIGANAKLRGLVYSEGDVSLSNVTLIGSLINNGADAESGDTLVDRVILLQDDVTVTLTPLRRGWARSTTSGDCTTMDDPAAYWFSIEATQTGPDQMSIVRKAFHPALGPIDCGQGVVRISDNAILSGDLSLTSAYGLSTALVHHLNEDDNSGASNVYPANPLQTLIAINYVNANIADLTSDFSWAGDHFQAGASRDPIELDFNHFLAPRDRLRVLDWKVYPLDS